jgi:hypothetical protein
VQCIINLVFEERRMNDGFGPGMLLGCMLTALISFLTVDSDIYPESFQHAEKMCSSNEGVEYLSEGLTRFSSVTCKNGAVFKFDNGKVREVVENED